MAVKNKERDNVAGRQGIKGSAARSLGVAEVTDRIPEAHPLEPFLPDGAKILMLGSFPPKRERWTMEFFYPNWLNDMWRVMGLAFYGDKEVLMLPDRRSFDMERIKAMCREKGIAIFDTAAEVVRLADNASDKFLEIVTPADVGALLADLPQCKAIVTTGQKATDTLTAIMECAVPPIGGWSEFVHRGRVMRLYRMPSTSRAYPLALDKKAAYYTGMLEEVLGPGAVFRN